MIGRLAREPLVHFLLAGAAIWGVMALAGEEVDPASRTIDLGREKQADLAVGFERMMGRPPTDAELAELKNRWVREEVLYREALRLGLDDGDPIVRRRLSTKMDELAGAQAEVAEPSEAELRAWLKQHPDRFSTGATVSFEQAYFPSEALARAALESPLPAGHEISLPASARAMPLSEVGKVFGHQFLDALELHRPGPQWQGPIPSGFGWHIVRLTARDPGTVPPLAQISERVEADWRSSTIADRREKAYRVLREAYRVEAE